MRTEYSTEALVGNREQQWQGVIRDVYANLEIKVAPDSRFSGRICRSVFGQIEATRVMADSEFAHRTKQHISRSAANAYIYLMVNSGRLDVVQFGRTCTVAPGEFTILDLDEPYRFSHAERVDKIGLKLPTGALRCRGSYLAERCAVSRSAQSGMERLAADYFFGLCDSNLSVTEDQAHALSRTACDLFSSLLETGEASPLPDDSAVRAAIRRRSGAFMAAHYSSPDLDPPVIADALGISVRYLHQCFEATNVTVMQVLKETRLAKSHADLEDTAMRHFQIGEIALRHGFRNVSHFNESFKARYGLTPRQVRRA